MQSPGPHSAEIWGGAQGSAVLPAWQMSPLWAALWRLSLKAYTNSPWATDGRVLIKTPEKTWRNTKKQKASFFGRLVMCYVTSRTFMIALDVTHLRCRSAWGFMPGLHVASLILTVLGRRWSPFCRRGNRNPEKLGKFPQALQVLRARTETQAQVCTASKPKWAPPRWVGCGLIRYSLKTALNRIPSSFFLRSDPPASLSIQGIYFKTVSYSVSPQQRMSQGDLLLVLIWVLRIP